MNKIEWTWKEYAEMVKFTKSPIRTSLLKFEKSELTNLAVGSFIGSYFFKIRNPSEFSVLINLNIATIFNLLNRNNEVYGRFSFVQEPKRYRLYLLSFAGILKQIIRFDIAYYKINIS